VLLIFNDKINGFVIEEETEALPGVKRVMHGRLIFLLVYFEALFDQPLHQISFVIFH
jgi:hypothetical protein